MAAPQSSPTLRDTGAPPLAADSPSPRPREEAEPELSSDAELDSDAELELEWSWSSCLSEESDEEQGGSAPGQLEWGWSSCLSEESDEEQGGSAPGQLEWGWSSCLSEESDEEQGGSAPGQPGERSAAAALLERCVAAGAVSQETLDLTCRRAPCFAKFAEMEEMVKMEAEINEIKLKTEMMQLENETADITHNFYLGKKCEILQDMNRHLEAILKEKRDLRKRLIKHRCQESLPIEATYHKSIVELLTEAVTFIEKLESHLQSVRSIPQIPHMMNNMDTTLSKTEVLMIELEELTEQILKWEELQKEVYSNNVCNTADLDFGLSLT